ncbi:MAG: EamA family transporter [Deltaproteobacteria bacterium]|nr:EamA family transporter [Deltaproteobacteria bacterium]MBI4795802.1 EamA family transporter [Deltaproteobacteria bacterium]
MNWLVFSLIALGLWGAWGFLSKVATQQLPPQAVYLLAICGHVVVAAYLWLGGGLTLPGHLWGIAAALAAGICMAFGLLCFFKALAAGAATVVVPLTALYPLVTVILSWALLRESLSPRHLAGIALALLAGWLLSK